MENNRLILHKKLMYYVLYTEIQEQKHLLLTYTMNSANDTNLLLIFKGYMKNLGTQFCFLLFRISCEIESNSVQTIYQLSLWEVMMASKIRFIKTSAASLKIKSMMIAVLFKGQIKTGLAIRGRIIGNRSIYAS